MSADPEPLTLGALNRALLARQGLLERIDAPLVDGVEAIGALQAQEWKAPPAALCARMESFTVEGLYQAMGRGELVIGTLVRATLHLLSAREHPAYAAAVAAAGSDDWRRTKHEPSPELGELRAELLAHLRVTPRSGEEIAAFMEAWIGRHPGAMHAQELARQRSLSWRPFLTSSSLVRAPADGRWGSRTPALLRAAPSPADAPTGEAALEEVIRRHLRAFGPAAPDDVAGWIGWRTPPVRDALERLAPQLEEFSDEGGRRLYDLPGSPRPDPETPAPPRLLGGFDSVLLAYATKHRARIISEADRQAVYERGNLRIRPSFLIDGFVAGTWSLQVRRGEAILTLQALRPIARPASAALIEEAERVATVLAPGARAHSVAFTR